MHAARDICFLCLLRHAAMSIRQDGEIQPDVSIC